MLHSFQLNGYNIIMDVNSGAVHVVDEMVYDMVQLLDASFLANSFDSNTSEKLEKEYPALVFAPLEARYDRAALEEDVYKRQAVELLAGIPSVVYGLVGMIVLVPAIREMFDLSSGASLLAAIIVLAIMILPSIINVSENALLSLIHI